MSSVRDRPSLVICHPFGVLTSAGFSKVVRLFSMPMSKLNRVSSHVADQNGSEPEAVNAPREAGDVSAGAGLQAAKLARADVVMIYLKFGVMWLA